MDRDAQIRSIVEIIEEMQEDASIPRNVKDRLAAAVKALEGKSDISIKVNKALHELEEIADDPNLQPYTRTQMWNIVSLLEKIA